MRSFLPLVVMGCAMLVACNAEKKPQIADGERLDIVLREAEVSADPRAQKYPVEIPDQADLPHWVGRNEAMLTPHIGLTGVEHHASARIGDGNRFARHAAPSPIVTDGLVIAMDAGGVVTAHEASDIDQIRWKNALAAGDRVDEVLGGGLTVADGIVYATAGFGKLAAIDLQTGETRWNVRVGAPVRGAPAVATLEKRVVVLTADNQTLAFDMATGAVRWEHRGIRESASYFSTTAPVISEGIVIACYSSGEVVALRAETGNVLWGDTVASTVKTKASSVFSGIDTDPLVQDGVVVVTSSSGQMQASALLNGRPLWQNTIGSHDTLWSAGNALFTLTTTHDLVAIFKRDGSVRWAQSLAQRDDKRDTTPPLYGPILAGNAVLIVSGDGQLYTFRPQDGKELHRYEIVRQVASAPVIAGGALYLVTQDAQLHKYY